LDYLKYQLENDRCTAEEIRSMYQIASRELDVDATAQDIAKFFDQKEANVRNICSRNYGDKPKRKVYHNLSWFIKVMPDSWLK
jgi:hypothetical protein